MDKPAADRDPLEILAEEFMEKQRRGESPSVEEYASRHPELAGEIRELFPTITAMERLKARSERSNDGLASLGPIRLERLGDFRILREIGRGGMGIVFEAEQESLGRRVALKVLPRQALLEDRYLARFKREAKIASRLHHTNIVQVYGVGEQDGFHYYIMQYVRGAGLDKVFRRLQDEQANTSTRALEGEAKSPANDLLETVVSRVVGTHTPGRPILSDPGYYRFLAALGQQAAGALAYAHKHGTLHRDIKPSNLLLDDQGIVWITDFGLAHATHVPQVTQAGDLTGTLRYLAPERLQGRTDERSDIYSLGLTLYELITLRPAFDETDRSTLIHRVSEQSLPPPRALNPAIPLDLETVVLKAVSREPEHRYATAAEMGDDLRRILDDRPILARQIGPAERLWRWGRRNKAVASLAASTLILIFAVAVVAAIGYLRTRNALTNEARQRQRAEAVATLASDVLDQIFARLGPIRGAQSTFTVGGRAGTTIPIISQPVISKETAALLEEMLPFYDRLAEQTGSDDALQRRTAGARRRIGDIHQRLGQYDQAIAAYRRTIDVYRDLMAGNASDQTLTVSLAQTYNELGRTCLLAKKLSDALDAHHQAENLLKGTETTASAPERFELAKTFFFLGQRIPSEPGARPPGPGRRPPPDQRPPPEDRPGSLRPEPGPDPAREERHRYLEQAIVLLKALNREQPENPDYRHLLALCYREILPPPGQDHLNPADNAVEILEGLVRDFPQIADYRFDLCETYAAIATTEPGQPRRVSPIMEQRLRKALTLSQQLTTQHPNVPEYKISQARIYHRLGEVFRTMHQFDDAEKSDRKALEVQTQLAKEFPDVLTYQVWEAAFRNSLADLLLLRDHLAETRAIAETNIAQTSRLLKDHPELWYLHVVLMETHRTLAAALRRGGQVDLAVKAENEARIHGSKLPERSSARPSDE
jgi:serine/threonine protein kinase